MISRQQQIQNIRKYIAEEIQNVGLKRTIITALKKNNQDVTGKLVNQILNVDYRKSSRYLQVRSKWNGNIGMVYDIKVDVLLPWGKYGAKLDTVEGRKSKAKGKMQPSTNDIYQWIIKKGLFKTGFYRQKKRLQSGTKTYVYSLNRASFQKGVAYRIARKIRKENELKTRNPYSSSLGIKLEFAVMKAFKRFADEFALDYLNDFTLNFGKAKK